MEGEMRNKYKSPKKNRRNARNGQRAHMERQPISCKCRYFWCRKHVKLRERIRATAYLRTHYACVKRHFLQLSYFPPVTATQTYTSGQAQDTDFNASNSMK